MLTKVKIVNFRALRNVMVRLKPLTVLIGANDSGKSSFLHAITRLQAGAEKIERGDFWQGDVQQKIQIYGEVASQSPVVATSREDGRWEFKASEASWRAVHPICCVQLPAAGVATQCAGFSEGSEAIELGLSGERVAALLDYLLRCDRARFDRINSVLQDLVPGFRNLRIATPNASERRIDLEIEGGLVLPAAEASAGVRLLLFFVALAYHPRPPRTILLEEPETGLHPRRLGEVMQCLREITEGKHGDYPAQVIMTTHSPYLLDFVDLERDQLLVFTRRDDGSRTAEPVDHSRLKVFLDEFKLGEVWFNETEAGLVGRPS